MKKNVSPKYLAISKEIIRKIESGELHTIIFYSRFVERFAEVDGSRTTPAYSMQDGVDYVPMPWWRVFLIQFLNIVGLGPIFGAVAGAMWGPSRKLFFSRLYLIQLIVSHSGYDLHLNY